MFITLPQLTQSTYWSIVILCEKHISINEVLLLLTDKNKLLMNNQFCVIKSILIFIKLGRNSLWCGVYHQLLKYTNHQCRKYSNMLICCTFIYIHTQIK